MNEQQTSRWYLTPVGRVVRAALGLPFLTLAVYLFWHGSIFGWVGGVMCALVGVSLPWAAVVQEPD